MSTTELEVGEPQDGVCSKEGCAATSTDNTCANGEVPYDCGYFTLAATPTEVTETQDTPVDTGILLPDGHGLRPKDLSRVLDRRPASVVVPLGHIEAGKTTLFTIIFEFLTGRQFRDWSFAGSATVIGFAQRRHNTSIESRRGVPIVDRTSRDASDQYLHVDARPADGGRVRSILMADISGEIVDEFAAGTVNPVVSAAIARADHIPILIDGAAVADPATRQNAIREARDILWVLAKQSRRPGSRVSLVLTKIDLIAGIDTVGVFQQVTNGLPGLDPEVATFKTADRTGPGASERGAGVEELLTYLVEPIPITHQSPWVPPQAPHISPVVARLWERAT